MANMKMVNGQLMPCTAEDEAFIAQKEADAQAESVAKAKTQYLDNRKMSYPPVMDLLLLLWADMDSGSVAQAKTFYEAIKAINDKYPAPV